MFRFTIRDVLWLTVVVALGVAWWVDCRCVERRSDARAITIRFHAEALRTALVAAREREMLRDSMTSYSRPLNSKSGRAQWEMVGPTVEWEMADKPIPQ